MDFEFLCQEYSCKELIDGVCSKYPIEYMEFVTRRNYCPFADLPKKEVKKTERRAGQQKSKKKK